MHAGERRWWGALGGIVSLGLGIQDTTGFLFKPKLCVTPHLSVVVVVVVVVMMLVVSSE